MKWRPTTILASNLAYSRAETKLSMKSVFLSMGYCGGDTFVLTLPSKTYSCVAADLLLLLEGSSVGWLAFAVTDHRFDSGSKAT